MSGNWWRNNIEHSKHYRVVKQSVKSLRRKFASLENSRCPIGAQSILGAVRRAKIIRIKITDRCDMDDGSKKSGLLGYNADLLTIEDEGNEILLQLLTTGPAFLDENLDCPGNNIGERPLSRIVSTMRLDLFHVFKCTMINKTERTSVDCNRRTLTESSACTMKNAKDQGRKGDNK